MNYTPQEMYSLVNDVEAYSSFLPWCSESSVLELGEESLRASVSISVGGVHKTFTTLNRLQPGKMMEIRLEDGPFKHLEGFWRFDPLGEEACKVALDLEYQFSSRVLGLVVGPVFDQIANSLVDAFCKRAVQVYGKR